METVGDYVNTNMYELLSHGILLSAMVMYELKDWIILENKKYELVAKRGGVGVVIKRSIVHKTWWFIL